MHIFLNEGLSLRKRKKPTQSVPQVFLFKCEASPKRRVVLSDLDSSRAECDHQSSTSPGLLFQDCKGANPSCTPQDRFAVPWIVRRRDHVFPCGDTLLLFNWTLMDQQEGSLTRSRRSAGACSSRLHLRALPPQSCSRNKRCTWSRLHVKQLISKMLKIIYFSCFRVR